MKYKLVPSSNMARPDNIYIYVLPSAFESSSYSIAYPDCSVDDILADKITIRQFDGCSTEAVNEINAEFKKRLKKTHLKYADRINTFFSIGIGVFILGVINWVVPDPLPLVDELLFTIGGGLTALKAWNDRKTKLPEIAEQTYRYGYEGRRPEVETDIILTTIFKSIRCKINPKESGDLSKDMDTIEIESLWMTKYLNIQDSPALKKATGYNLKDLIQMIEKVFPLKKISSLERKKQSRKIRMDLEKLKQETLQKTGVSTDALAVYVEFYLIYYSN